MSPAIATAASENTEFTGGSLPAAGDGGAVAEGGLDPPLAPGICNLLTLSPLIDRGPPLY